ncbi:MAG: hypothetical protein KKA19_03620 [Candidatus Margulisbacteria bacterium]|nr:hypothetical protein [Candidatus Margulisiibacteriota bacterium]
MFIFQRKQHEFYQLRNHCLPHYDPAEFPTKKTIGAPYDKIIQHVGEVVNLEPQVIALKKTSDKALAAKNNNDLKSFKSFTIEYLTQYQKMLTIFEDSIKNKQTITLSIRLQDEIKKSTINIFNACEDMFLYSGTDEKYFHEYLPSCSNIFNNSEILISSKNFQKAKKLEQQAVVFVVSCFLDNVFKADKLSSNKLKKDQESLNANQQKLSKTLSQYNSSKVNNSMKIEGIDGKMSLLDKNLEKEIDSLLEMVPLKEETASVKLMPKKIVAQYGKVLDVINKKENSLNEQDIHFTEENINKIVDCLTKNIQIEKNMRDVEEKIDEFLNINLPQNEYLQTVIGLQEETTRNIGKIPINEKNKRSAEALLRLGVSINKGLLKLPTAEEIREKHGDKAAQAYTKNVYKHIKNTQDSFINAAQKVITAYKAKNISLELSEEGKILFSKGAVEEAQSVSPEVKVKPSPDLISREKNRQAREEPQAKQSNKEKNQIYKLEDYISIPDFIQNNEVRKTEQIRQILVLIKKAWLPILMNSSDMFKQESKVQKGNPGKERIVQISAKEDLLIKQLCVISDFVETIKDLKNKRPNKIGQMMKIKGMEKEIAWAEVEEIENNIKKLTVQVVQTYLIIASKVLPGQKIPKKREETVAVLRVAPKVLKKIMPKYGEEYLITLEKRTDFLIDLPQAISDMKIRKIWELLKDPVFVTLAAMIFAPLLVTKRKNTDQSMGTEEDSELGELANIPQDIEPSDDTGSQKESRT